MPQNVRIKTYQRFDHSVEPSHSERRKAIFASLPSDLPSAKRWRLAGQREAAESKAAAAVLESRNQVVLAAFAAAAEVALAQLRAKALTLRAQIEALRPRLAALEARAAARNARGEKEMVQLSAEVAALHIALSGGDADALRRAFSATRSEDTEMMQSLEAYREIAHKLSLPGIQFVHRDPESYFSGGIPVERRNTF